MPKLFLQSYRVNLPTPTAIATLVSMYFFLLCPVL